MDERVREAEAEAEAEAGPAAAPGAAPQAINVEVIATRDWDNGVNFMCRWEFPANSGIWHSGPMVTDQANGAARDIVYNLVDLTGLGLQFENPARDAIWVNFGVCPAAGPGNDLGQIPNAHKNKPNPHRLTLKNVNNRRCDLLYALRFVGNQYSTPYGDFGPQYVYDPEYRNGGGGGGNS